MPQRCGAVTAKTALAATAASAADPPRWSIANPAAEARWSTEATIPRGACRVTLCTSADYGPRTLHVMAPVRFVPLVAAPDEVRDPIVFVVGAGTVLVHEEPEHDLAEAIFLGTLDGRPCWAVAV